MLSSERESTRRTLICWQVLNIFRYEGESAKTANRPQFQQMLGFVTVKKNAVAYVVVHELSRLSRQMEDQVSVLADLKNAGVQLRSFMENVDETAGERSITPSACSWRQARGGSVRL